MHRNHPCRRSHLGVVGAWVCALGCLAARPTPAGAQSKGADAPAPWPTSPIADWNQVPASAAEPRFAFPRGREFRLQNQLRVILVEDHRLPLCGFLLLVDGAGSAADPKDKPGLAAFTADLLDEGIAGGLDALTLDAHKDELGAKIDISTGYDQSTVHIFALKRTLAPTLALVADIVTRPAFSEADAQRVHADRITNLELKPDRPREVADDVLFGALFGPDSAYGHPIDGVATSFAQVTRVDAQTFYANHWAPARMTLVVAGDVTEAELMPLLRSSLGAWRHPAPRTPSVRVARSADPARLLLVDRPGAPQADVRAGLWGIVRDDSRYAQLRVLTNLLGGSFTSRLNNRLREQLGYTYGARALSDTRRWAGTFTISTALFTPKVVDGVSEIRQMLAKLRTPDYPALELDKAKQNLIRDLPGQFETLDDTTSAFADLTQNGLPLTWYARYAKELASTSAQDLQRLSRTLIRDRDLRYVVVGDLATVRAGLEALKLGPTKLFDKSGAPLPTAP